MFRRPLTLFRTLAIAEAVSWTLLIAGLVLRALTGVGVGVTIGGAVHGLVFLAYGATALLVALNQRWGAAPTVVALASAIVPYATVPAEVWLQRTGRLDGAWRLAATDDPRDRARRDRALRALLNHPRALVAALVLGVIAVFAILLLVGPPGGSH